MEVILKEDVNNLGYKGDIVKVKDGYARNYLIPTKKAVIATDSAKKMLEEEKKQRAHKLERIKNEALELAEKAKSINLVIEAKASSTGKIFGAVGPIQIADAYEKAGLVIDRKVIVVDEPVKELGSYKATLKLHREVSVEISFEVIGV
ncbi:MAG TPA: 50S ribosomal protein L9 [Paludibacteraceae bacterium]|jgi:large subunit ribosomal protein L9|nr:50S ribosomal protein L9 [Paludibacteraceae bacterium]OPZ01254.1 MAG: 50S ribosomal protein L9 [Bacteroidetes bacterium ADurb.BinA395]HOF98387.1 50S ribosomal protein L9 [Paludibacteraceae bacterium]HOJ65501.1 50S ribosomal protein L9 [Paludibacteraceae bacterium]HOL29194.1 50S ribosomal protein L9 [Paludibacteraceae bacterium]